MFDENHYPWEQQAALDLKRYVRGRKLIRLFGRIELDDHLALERLREGCLPDEFDDYVFVLEHEDRLRQDKLTQRAKIVAAALAPIVGKLGQQATLPVSVHDDRPLTTEPLPCTPLNALAKSFLESKTGSLSTPKSYAHKLNLFIRFVEEHGNTTATVEGLNAETMRAYAEFIRKLPKRLAALDAGSIRKVVEGYQGETIAQKTIQSHFGAVRVFLRWVEKKEYRIKPKLYGILDFERGDIAKKKRLPMSAEDIAAIFGCDAYRNGTFKRASDFWIPLLGIHTGAREGELCQLATDDVYRDEKTGIWVFDFNVFGQDGKRLKVRQSGARIIPVHKGLKTLGFLDYVAEMKSAGHTTLFPNEVRDSVGHFGAFSKRVMRFIRKCGVQPPLGAMKDFHSFRHNVASFLVDQGCEEYIVNAILGHSQADRSESVRTYSSGPKLGQLDKWLQKMDFGLPYAHIRPKGWKRRWASR